MAAAPSSSSSRQCSRGQASLWWCMIMASVMAPSPIRAAAATLGPNTGVAIRVSKKPVPHSADKATSWKKYRLFTGRVFRAR